MENETRRKIDFERAVVNMAKDQVQFLNCLIIFLRDTDLNTKSKRLQFAKGLEEGRLREILHFISEEKRLGNK